MCKIELKNKKNGICPGSGKSNRLWKWLSIPSIKRSPTICPVRVWVLSSGLPSYRSWGSNRAHIIQRRPDALPRDLPTQTDPQLLSKHLLVLWRRIHGQTFCQQLVPANGLPHEHRVSSSAQLWKQQIHDQRNDQNLQNPSTLQTLTRDGLGQDQLHLLLGWVFGVLHQPVDSVSPRVQSRGTAHFGQRNLPPSFDHHRALRGQRSKRSAGSPDSRYQAVEIQSMKMLIWCQTSLNMTFLSGGPLPEQVSLRSAWQPRAWAAPEGRGGRCPTCSPEPQQRVQSDPNLTRPAVVQQAPRSDHRHTAWCWS